MKKSYFFEKTYNKKIHVTTHTMVIRKKQVLLNLFVYWTHIGDLHPGVLGSVKPAASCCQLKADLINPAIQSRFSRHLSSSCAILASLGNIIKVFALSKKHSSQSLTNIKLLLSIYGSGKISKLFRLSV